MEKFSVLNGKLTPSEVKELNRAAKAMRLNRLLRFGVVGDVDGYLQFLTERQALFGTSHRILKKLSIEKSHIL
ncbi:MAG: hypothetical protein KKD69_01055 [Euryarchaeota archaeon]|nr:hypothetical protein [Euryarchaeota archaeon]